MRQKKIFPAEVTFNKSHSVTYTTYINFFINPFFTQENASSSYTPVISFQK